MCARAGDGSSGASEERDAVEGSDEPLAADSEWIGWDSPVRLGAGAGTGTVLAGGVLAGRWPPVVRQILLLYFCFSVQHLFLATPCHQTSVRHITSQAMISARTIRAAAKQALAVNAKIVPRVVCTAKCSANV